MRYFLNDIVGDVLQRAVDAAQKRGSFDISTAAEIEMAVREMSGGVRNYVYSCKELKIARRDSQIRKMALTGEYKTNEISRIFGISERSVRRITNK